jgi:hypothetical protein
VEAKAARAADALDMEFENDNDSYTYDPNVELIDFNEEDQLSKRAPTAKKP